MDTTSVTVSRHSPNSPPARASRRLRTMAEKRRIVEEALAPGASVAAVARRHDVNANLVFGWRKLYQAGLFKTAGPEPTALVPVRMKKPARSSSRTPGAPMAALGVIEIELAQARLRLHGAIDPRVLRDVIEALT